MLSVGVSLRTVGVGAGVGAPAAPDVFFANTGCTWPWTTATTPPARYFADTDTTWFSWEAGVARNVRAKTYNHTTGVWTREVIVPSTGLSDDDHGVPSLVRDSDGYVYVFYGSHNTTQRASVTTLPNDPSNWRALSNIGSTFAYPHGYFVTDSIYLMLRDSTVGTNLNLALFKSTSLVAGTPTWGAKVTLIDFDTNSRFYQGGGVVVGTDIHFVATRADSGDNERQHVYYFVYDTVTGAVQNFDSTFSVASGSLPMTLTDANTNCRIFTHVGASQSGTLPHMALDTNGHPHVLFCDGTVDGVTYNFTAPGAAVKHIWHNGTSWQTVVDTGFKMHEKYSGQSIYKLPAGAMGIAWTRDDDSEWARGGDIWTATRSSAGVWSAPSLLAAAGSTYALDMPVKIEDGDADARFVFAEISGDSAAESGTLKCYAHGDSGFLYPAAYTPAGNVEFVAAGISAAGTTTIIPTIPSVGVAPGMVAIALFTARATTGTFTPPSGWTHITGSPSTPTVATRHAVMWRVLEVADLNPSFLHSGGLSELAQIAVFKNVNQSSPIGTVGTLYDPGGTALTIGPILGITATAGQMVICFGAFGDDFTGASVLSDGVLSWQEIGEVTTQLGSDAGIVWDYAQIPSDLAVANQTFTLTGTANGRTGLMFSLNKA